MQEYDNRIINKSDYEKLRQENTELLASLDRLKTIACDLIGLDGYTPVCNCCGMCLELDGKGHRRDCLAEAILSLPYKQPEITYDI